MTTRTEEVEARCFSWFSETVVIWAFGGLRGDREGTWVREMEETGREGKKARGEDMLCVSGSS